MTRHLKESLSNYRAIIAQALYLAFAFGIVCGAAFGENSLPSVRSSSQRPPDQKLLGFIFPDVDQDGVAHKSTQIRNIHADFEPAQISDEVTVTVGSRVPVQNAGRRDLLVEIKVDHKGDGSLSDWGGEDLLALYRTAPSLKLLDVVDIRGDRECGLWSNPTLLHAGKSDTPIIYCSHLSAGADHLILEVLEFVRDKIVPSKVGSGMFFGLTGTTSEITEAPHLRPITNSNPPKVVWVVKAIGRLVDEDTRKPKKTEVKTFKATLTATGGRWVCPSCAAMQKSLRQMETRFGFDSQ